MCSFVWDKKLTTYKLHEYKGKGKSQIEKIGFISCDLASSITWQRQQQKIYPHMICIGRTVGNRKVTTTRRP